MDGGPGDGGCEEGRGLREHYSELSRESIHPNFKKHKQEQKEMSEGLVVRKDGELDFVSLGALVHRDRKSVV